ncbi:MAG: Gfo/Idh/MocA family oxidoreductase [Bacteroidota bacterium]
MATRRTFLQDIGKGAVLSTVGLTSSSVLASIMEGLGYDPDRPIRIGIIGAENSHTRGFGKLFNIDKQFPGVEVKYVWGETEAFALDAMARGGIPNKVDDPLEMLGKIDALIVDHRHGKYHLEAAKPFVEAGIPSFIDKPFCYRVAEGKEFLAMARRKGTPVTSYSSIGHHYDTFNIRSQVEALGDIRQVVMFGPLDIDSEYGGVFFYGAHMVQPLMNVFGEDVQKVRITQTEKSTGASLVFGDGMLASFVFTPKHYEWRTFVEGDDGLKELKPTEKAKSISKADSDMVRMFQTGEEPRSHESILQGVAILEALEKSAESGDWVQVESVTL